MTITDIPKDVWNAAARQPDLSHEYLTFRERLEPGAPVVLTVDGEDGLAGAVHGVVTTDASGLFSHPWKLLTGEQFSRFADDDDSARATHAELVDAAGELGSALTVRAYDTSELVLPRPEAAGQLVRGLQDAVRDGRADAVVLPYVRPDDEVLRKALQEAGFRSGCVTGASTFDLAGISSYEDFVAGLPSKVRRHHNNKPEDGVTIVDVPLASAVDRIADMEAQTAVRNGGTADVGKLRAARTLMAELLPDSVRVAGAELDGQLVACAVQLVGASGCDVLAYGCDYAVSDRSIAYHHLMFDEPIAHCVAHGVPSYRLGFEAFHPKRQRGARVERREMWLWLPDEPRLERVDALLRFVTDRNSSYLRTFGA